VDHFPRGRRNAALERELAFEAADGKMMAVAVKAVAPSEQSPKPSF
jgi:hypothetical protein